MKGKLFYILFVAAFTVATVGAQDAAAPAPAAEGDDDWLNTVWTQVDAMVEEEEFKLQETVTVAGVRGAEAEDNILGSVMKSSVRSLMPATTTIKLPRTTPRPPSLPRPRKS